MRRSTKVFAFMMAAALTGSACGSDSSPSDGSAATADTATTDTAGDDRDRNVQVGGWGVDGSGVAETVVNDRTWTNIDTRVFRRVRTEVIDKRKYVNTRDVFVATMVARFENGNVRTIIKVAGFDTGGDEVANYPISGFGTGGVVTVDLASDDPNRSSIPIGWTVVSRDLLAAFFGPASEDPQDRGVVEYYNLKTGELEKNLGTDGRTTIPMGVPIQLITDIGLRRVDDDGTLRLLLAGVIDFGEPQASAAVFGFTPDGTFDPFVGDDGAGVLNLAGLTPSAGDFTVSNVRLTDPGVNGAPGIGVIVVSEAPSAVAEGERWVPLTNLVTFIVAREDAATRKVSMLSNASYMAMLDARLSNVEVRNAILTSTGAVAAHISSTEPGSYWWQSGYVHHRFVVSSRQQTDEILAEPAWEGEDGPLDNYERYITNVSDEGKDFVVSTFTNSETDLFELRVCFDVARCYETGSTVSVNLIAQVLLENAYTTLGSMTVDETGVHVIMRYVDNIDRNSIFRLASIDPSGTGSGKISPNLDESFDTFESFEVDGVTQERWVSDPRPMTKDSVGALQSDGGPKTLRLQKVGDSAIDKSFSLPLGIDDVVSGGGSFVPLGPRHVGLIANIADGDRWTQRLYKVSVDNGSVDTSFGTDGYVVLPPPPFGKDMCGSVNYLLSNNGTVTVLTQEFTTTVVDGVNRCIADRVKLHWQAFDSRGRPIGTKMSSAEMSLEVEESQVGFAGDGNGGLAYLTEKLEFDENGEYVSRSIRVRKLSAEGAPDTTFASKGTLTMEIDSPSAIAFDAEGRLYLAILQFDTLLQVYRYTAAGVLDVSTNVEPSPSTVAPTAQVTVPPQVTVPVVEQRAREQFELEQQEDEFSRLPANDGLTVTSTKPVITAVRALEDRSLTVSWAISAAAGSPYVTATAVPGGRSCTSNTDSCVIRGLDPSQKYTVTVALKGETASASAAAISATPVVSMKVGRVASPTTFVRPASRGAATWKVRGGCTLNANNTRITAPQRAAKCQLSVTTAKFGSTPKTTKSVTIVVKK